MTVRVVDVYPYRLAPGGPRAGGRPEFAVFRRAPGRLYAGQWRMVGGKIRPAERAWEAALRELREETGLRPRRLWALPSVNVFYEWGRDAVNIAPAFAAELAGEVALDPEHDAVAWLGADEAAARLVWPEQQRLLLLADRLLRADAVAPELEVVGSDQRTIGSADR